MEELGLKHVSDPLWQHALCTPGLQSKGMLNSASSALKSLDVQDKCPLRHVGLKVFGSTVLSLLG